MIIFIILRFNTTVTSSKFSWLVVRGQTLKQSLLELACQFLHIFNFNWYDQHTNLDEWWWWRLVEWYWCNLTMSMILIFEDNRKVPSYQLYVGLVNLQFVFLYEFSLTIIALKNIKISQYSHDPLLVHWSFCCRHD